MAEADPDNEVGHFSLGRAYLDAQMNHEAAESFRRVIALNPNLSKVYQLLATALLRERQNDQAIAQLTIGVGVADERGEFMPRNEMLQMLKDLGAPLPEIKGAAQNQVVGEGQVLCNRCGKVGPRMAKPPFSNDQGKLIYEKICQPCWREWIGMGTKVINELRLPLSDPRAQKEFDRHMLEFLNLK
jgi:Fe-S cluster biosynthesis and repair protein YggX